MRFIWICMNCALKRAYTISRYSIRHDPIYGNYTDTARHDLLQVILIRLPGERHKNEPKNRPTDLMKLLAVTFSEKMSAEKKLEEISNMGIVVTRELEGRVNTMCNLSQGLIDTGLKAGRREGRIAGLQEGRKEERRERICFMLRSGKNPEEIAEFCGFKLEEVKEAQKDLFAMQNA